MHINVEFTPIYTQISSSTLETLHLLTNPPPLNLLQRDRKKKEYVK